MNRPLPRNNQPEVGEEGVLGGHTSWWYHTLSSLMEGYVSPSMHQPLTLGILRWGPEQMCTSATRSGLEDKGYKVRKQPHLSPISLCFQQAAGSKDVQPNKYQRLKPSIPIPPHPQEVQGPMASFLSCIPREASPPPSCATQAEAFWEAKRGREIPDRVHLSLTHYLILHTSLHSSAFCSLS